MNVGEDFNKLLDLVIDQKRINFSGKIKKAKIICVFGAGNMFIESYEFILEKVNIDYLCDNDEQKWGKYIKGILCISPAELLKKESVLVILALSASVEIAKYLVENNIDYINHFNLIWDKDDRELIITNEIKKSILHVMEQIDNDESRCLYRELIVNRIAPELALSNYKELRSSEIQYLTLKNKFKDNEVIVDCGAFDGDTVGLFINEFGEKIEKIYAFELDSTNFKNLQHFIDSNSIDREIRNKIEIINSGVGSSSAVISYNKTSSMHSNIRTDSDGEVATIIKLDELLADRKISFIKMDIEGWELEALKGAEKLIKNNKPKLAICIYHKFSDLWLIPNLIKTYREDYSFILRHHSDYWSETVLYAY